MAASTRTQKSYRDSGTGQFVTKKYADQHPKTTQGETNRHPAPSKGKK